VSSDRDQPATQTHRRLAGKVAWISGATSGIGLATAERMAREGAAVAVVDINGDRCGEVAEQLNRTGHRALAVHCDVADETQVASSIAMTARHFGGLHIVVNNAGIVDVLQLHESTTEQWDRLMAVNVRSIFLSLKHALPHFKQNDRSYVVNVGSVSSFIGQAGTPAYTTSKHAVLGLTRSIALDYAVDGIRCNCVCPGITDTPLLRKHLNATPNPDAALADRLRRVAMGVILSPDDVARSIVYLACEDSAGVTGTSVVIDAGYLAAAEWTHPGTTRFTQNREPQP
jgi:NAD(P)-dependent dehydrogenase (short-subunit alcohol dehydrogenase family)